jgi:hypothetical protein
VNRRLLLVPTLIGSLVAQPLSAQTASVIGELLQPGMRLVYASNGEALPPWEIDSIVTFPAPSPGSACAIVHLRRQPTQPDQTRLCLARDTLFSWDSGRQHWSPSRPVADGMRLTVPRRAGGTIEYQTDGASADTISGRVIPVIITTVTTMDSLGRAIRRLRERYAIGLATATRGTFEIPDSGSGAWRPQQVFELRAIEQP